jgi:hypothetical protein
VRCGAPAAAWRGAFAGANGTEQGGRLFGHLAGRDCRGLCLAGGHLPDPAPADRVGFVAIAGLWPGHGWWRAVVNEPG